MSDPKQRAREVLKGWKGDDYVFGLGCADRLGELVAGTGRRAAVVASGGGKDWGVQVHETLGASLEAGGVERVGAVIPGPRPNAPREDVLRIAEELADRQPETIVTVGAGSCIDAAKAATVLWTLGGGEAELDETFGVGKVSDLLATAGKHLPPIVAQELAASSAAHLTKYSNVTDLDTAQKKLIVDEAIVPPKALFDYAQTRTMDADFTADGALDGVSHSLEVFYGAGGETLERVRPVATLGIELIVRNLKAACDDGGDLNAREGLGLGTDLGGYSIMIGGTNGAHLTSFSLVDVLSHGRACALMNPYYTVFFAPAIEPQLRDVGRIFADAGYTDADLEALSGRDLGLAVAEAMLALCREIGFPTTLREVQGFKDEHIARALQAAKNPQLEMKLKNMPVPLSAQSVDDYMGPVLEAAATGDLSRIRNLQPGEEG